MGANVQAEVGDFPAAAENFKRARELRIGTSSILTEGGLSLLADIALFEFRQGNYEACDAILADTDWMCSLVEKDDVRLQRVQAVVALRRREFDVAERLLTRALSSPSLGKLSTLRSELLM